MRQPLQDIIPRLVPIHQTFDRRDDLVLRAADLFRGVSFSERDGAVTSSVEVDDDAEGGTEFVVS